MNQSISTKTALFLLLLFCSLLGLKFWADGKALDYRGPDHMHTDTAGRLYIQIGNHLVQHDANGVFLRQYDLGALDIETTLGDFAFFNNGDILLHRGHHEMSFIEGLRHYARKTNKTPLQAPDTQTGLFRCNLDTSNCSRFGDGSVDFNRTFYIAIDPANEDVYVTDSSRHTLRKFDRDGNQIAVQEQGFRFPNQVSLINNQLYIADTNHHQIHVVDPATANFGQTLSTHSTLSNNNAAIDAQTQLNVLGQTWPATFLHLNDQWWINNFRNDMNRGGIYIFDKDWYLLKLADLPEDADPMDLVSFNGNVLVSDLSLDRVYQFDPSGERLTDFRSQGLSAALAEVQSQRKRYHYLSTAAMAVFIGLFVVLFVIALKTRDKSKPRQSQQSVTARKPASTAPGTANTNTAAQPTVLPFTFTGNTREYFGIWIMNILLTIVTLGIYSAWAKVRTNRYFYGNTLLDDAPFEYLANPIAILKGWAIAIAAFAVYSGFTHFIPASQLLFMLVFFLLLPWLVVRSLAFRLYNSSYRNLRFHFDREYGKAFKIFFGFGLLVPLTLGLLLPSYIYRQRRFIVDHSHYGKSPFQFKTLESKFYEIYGIAIAILFVGGLTFSLVTTLMGHLFAGSGAEAITHTAASGKPSAAPLIVMVPMFFGMGLVYLFFFAFINTRIYNAMWNGTQVAGNRFQSTLKVKTMAWLYLTNALAIMLSFGLMVPWARIRMARYKIDNLSLHTQGSLDNFVAGESQQVSATGEELGEVFDIDIGL